MQSVSDLDLALRAADAADAVSMRYFRGSFSTERKADGSVVTNADRECERAVLSVVRAEHPADAFLGEETGTIGHAARRWIVDGIDGTTDFAAGSSQWGTLVALEIDARITLGVAAVPALGQRWCASDGTGAWHHSSDGTRTRLSVSSRAAIEGSSSSILPLRDSLQGRRASAADHLALACHLVHAWNHPALLVASGELDCAVSFGGGPWDHAAMVALVREAGGAFSDLAGGNRLDTSTAIFSNGLLHESLLDHLRPFADLAG